MRCRRWIFSALGSLVIAAGLDVVAFSEAIAVAPRFRSLGQRMGFPVGWICGEGGGVAFIETEEWTRRVEGMGWCVVVTGAGLLAYGFSPRRSLGIANSRDRSEFFDS